MGRRGAGRVPELNLWDPCKLTAWVPQDTAQTRHAWKGALCRRLSLHLHAPSARFLFTQGTTPTWPWAWMVVCNVFLNSSDCSGFAITILWVPLKPIYLEFETAKCLNLSAAHVCVCNCLRVLPIQFWRVSLNSPPYFPSLRDWAWAKVMVPKIGRMSVFVRRDIANICWKGCGSLLRSVSVMEEGHVPGTTELVGFGKSMQGDKVLADLGSQICTEQEPWLWCHDWACWNVGCPADCRGGWGKKTSRRILVDKSWFCQHSPTSTYKKAVAVILWIRLSSFQYCSEYGHLMHVSPYIHTSFWLKGKRVHQQRVWGSYFLIMVAEL